MEREMVDKLAKTLLFEVSDSEYEEIKDDLMEDINLIEKLAIVDNDIEPMFYPFDIEVIPREDKVVDELSCEEILKNSKNNKYNQVKVPRVVE